ncbi:MAG: DUF3365 domain-containing protein [Alphaproteobacteria bacterium]|nr:DUF3365 domain-containing protein [Alphaproteobacteria bacterium]
MNTRTDGGSGLAFLRLSGVAALALWSLLALGSGAWNIVNQRDETRSLATREARSHFNKDTAFRFWASSHGGVYVPTDDRTPPNPSLSHLPERDIVTPSGKPLTLMNPAYMLRQLMTEYERLYGVKGKITAFPDMLFNPQNSPDAWELAALNAFAQGKDEAFEFSDIDGKPYLRLMRPLMVQKSCLKCHEIQGYKEGELRGGVGVAVPMSAYLEGERRQIGNLVLSHGLIWLLGAIAIVMVTRRSLVYFRERIEVEDKLQAAMAAAEEASKSKSRFLAIMSHELRTPLNAINGFSQMMENRTFGELSPQYHEYSRLIHSSGEHLLGIINQILDLSKIEAGKIELEEQEIFMGALIDEVFGMLEHMVNQKGVRLVNKTNDLHTMWVDPVRIKQALFNVIGNALKFTEQGEVTVFNRCDAEGHRIIVRDTGSGMSVEELAVALKPFGQVHADAYTRRLEGTGLGLSLTQHIMRLHGGELQIASAKGQGTEVILFFPTSRHMDEHEEDMSPDAAEA